MGELFSMPLGHERNAPMEDIDRNIPFKALEIAYFQSAKIVSIYGEVYLPIFERLEKEYIKRNKKRDTLRRAIKLSDELQL